MTRVLLRAALCYMDAILCLVAKNGEEKTLRGLIPLRTPQCATKSESFSDCGAKENSFSACERGLKKDRAHLRAKVLASHFCHAYSAAERRSEIYSPACSSNKSFGFCCAKIADATTPFGNHQKKAKETHLAGFLRAPGS